MFDCCNPTALEDSNNNKRMDDFKDVILHVYQLTDVAPAPEQSNRNNRGNNSSGSGTNRTEGGSGSWFTRTFLPAIGLGAYHTSLQIHGYRYTFTGNYGIVKCFSHVELTGLPPNAIFQESIKLGRSPYERTEVNSIVKILGDEFFAPEAYHLVHRNCNHFTETFATALVLGNQLAETDVKRFETYPPWINRLANTGQMVVAKDVTRDTRTCMPVEEARKAVGADKKVGWSLSKTADDTNAKNNTSSGTKKELTEAQKSALAKIRHK